MNELYTIRTKVEFESAHSIREYVSDTENECKYIDEDINGNTWVVEEFASSHHVEKRTGFAFDFLVLKQKVNELAHKFDHKFINEIEPFDKINPSTENLAKYFYNEIKTIIPVNSWLDSVRIYEGPNNYAEYRLIND